MNESQHRDPEDYAHVSPQADRDMHDADDRYSIAVFIKGKQYVATQDEATIETRGFSAAEAIVNFALAVDAKNNGEQVVADE